MLNDNYLLTLQYEFRRGRKSPPTFILLTMIDKQALQAWIEERLQDTECYLVDVTVSAQNEIKVEIDSMDSIDIDFCVELSRDIETAFPRDDEDYELEVGSAGLTSPFKVLAQYRKNLGNKVEVLTRDGRKLHGILVEADDDRFAIEMQVKVKREGAKRPVEETQREEFAYSDVKSVCYDLDF